MAAGIGKGARVDEPAGERIGAPPWEDRLAQNPRLQRLAWVLDGLDGMDGWGHDAAEVIAPEFAAKMAAERITAMIRGWSAAHAPVNVTSVEFKGWLTLARISDHAGDIAVVSCLVDANPPHRITGIRISGLVPAGLTPGLPMDFAEYPIATAGDGAQLVVVSGVPGVGKSTLAEAVGRSLGIPVFAGDWLLGSLTPFGGHYFERQLEMGEEMLTTLALRQLSLGQSAILDFPVEDLASRARWRSLAGRVGARFSVVVCVCSDRQVHRARLEGRSRGIPGWHDAGNWANVERRLAAFAPWDGEVLTVDTVQPHDDNVAAVIGYLRRSR
jgi:predicted kinase